MNVGYFAIILQTPEALFIFSYCIFSLLLKLAEFYCSVPKVLCYFHSAIEFTQNVFYLLFFSSTISTWKFL